MLFCLDLRRFQSMIYRFDGSLSSLQRNLLEAVNSALQPADATAAAIAKIFPAALTDVKVSDVCTVDLSPALHVEGALSNKWHHPLRAQCSCLGVLIEGVLEPLQDGSGSFTLRQLHPEERQVLDQAARSVLAQMVAGAVSAETEAMAWRLQPNALPAVPRLLDMMLLTSEQKWMDPG